MAISKPMPRRGKARFLPALPILLLWAGHTALPAAGAAAQSIGDVLYIRRDGGGLRVQAERGSFQIDFPGPSMVRIRDASRPLSPAIPPLVRQGASQSVEFKSVDPRYESIQTGVLEVSLSRTPFRIAVKERDGKLLIGDSPDGGLSLTGATGWRWDGQYAPESEVRGFGRPGVISPGAGALLRFAPRSVIWDHACLKRNGSVMWPAPAGVMGRCGIIFQIEGDASLAFPEAGRFAMENEAPLDICLFLAPGADEFRGALRELQGKPALPPRWLFGLGMGVGKIGSFRDMINLPAALQEDRLPVEWLLFPATRQETRGWNSPLGSLKPDDDLPPGLAQTIRQIQDSDVRSVFEIPSPFDPVPMFTSPPDREGDASASLRWSGKLDAERRARVLATADFPVDYANKSAVGSFRGRLEPLLTLGMAHWFLSEDPLLPPSADDPGDEPGDGAARPRIRRQAWSAALEGTVSKAKRGFVLDPFAGPDSESAGHWLAPFKVEPHSTSPEETLRWADAASQSGMSFWGLELPLEASAYPSENAFRRWLQAAAASPFALLRGVDWKACRPTNATEGVRQELQRLAEMRARLRPFAYSLARSASLGGGPMARPAPASAGNPGAMKSARGGMLLGDSILTVPLRAEDASNVRVWLPSGLWIDLNDDRRYEGGREYTMAVEPGRMEAFARAGTAIPYIGGIRGGAGRYPVCRIYPTHDPGAFTLYEDDGEGMGYLGEQFAATRFSWNWDAGAGALEIAIDGPLGLYAEKLGKRDLILQILLSAPPQAVDVDGHIVSRFRTVMGPSRLLDREAPLHLNNPVIPLTPVWDHDGQSFLYVMLGQRAGASRVKIFLGPSSGGNP